MPRNKPKQTVSADATAVRRKGAPGAAPAGLFKGPARGAGESDDDFLARMANEGALDAISDGRLAELRRGARSGVQQRPKTRGGDR